MKQFSVNEILEGVRKRNNKILQYVYCVNYPVVKRYILDNNGDIQDAQDLFQEGIVIIFRKLSSETLNIDCSFETYFVSVCKLLWIKELEKRRVEKMDKQNLKDYMDLESELGFDNSEHEKYKFFQKHLKLLEPDCQKILTLFYDGVSIRDIARIMGFKSEISARQKKFKCKERLIKNIKSDPKYKNISGSG